MKDIFAWQNILKSFGKRLTTGTNKQDKDTLLLHSSQETYRDKACMCHFDKSETGCIITSEVRHNQSTVEQQGAFKIKISISIRPISNFSNTRCRSRDGFSWFTGGWNVGVQSVFLKFFRRRSAGVCFQISTQSKSNCNHNLANTETTSLLN